MNTEKWLYVACGGVIGGLAAYLAADVLAFKLKEKAELHMYNNLAEEYRKFEQEHPEEVQEKHEHVNYAGMAKPSLTDIGKEYTSDDAPRVMNIDEFPEVSGWNSREVILYYALDGVYVDENEEIIDNPQNRFGPNAHLHFGEDSDDPNVVYIINRGEGVIYEIIREDSSYKVEVLGEVEEPPKKVKVTRKQPGRPRGSKNKQKELEEEGEIESTDK